MVEVTLQQLFVERRVAELQETVFEIVQVPLNRLFVKITPGIGIGET